MTVSILGEIQSGKNCSKTSYSTSSRGYSRTNSSGKNFKPHVTISVAPPDDLKKMCDEKFEAFTFSPAGAAVYHLGNFGTARKKLKSWELKL
jgi:hypothetical protein